jgi:predicted deacylase
MANGNPVFGGITVPPGRSARVDVPVSKNYDFTDVVIPLKVLRGRGEGPTLFVSAGMHGDEVLGVEVIRRVLSSRIVKGIKGTLITIPVVNALAFNSKSRYLPDRRDLNRCFPGAEKGSLGAQIAHILLREVISKCTHGIDIHTGAIHRPNYPQIRACLDSNEIVELAQAFNAPVILDAPLRDGSLREAAVKFGIPTLVYEGGEALRYDEQAIRVAVLGIFSVMRHIGMLPEKKKLSRYDLKKSHVACSSYWVRANNSGVLRTRKGNGAIVKKNEWLGTISDPFGLENHKVLAKESGIIIGRTNLPLVNNGDALFHIAVFDDNIAVREQVKKHEELVEEEFREEL